MPPVGRLFRAHIGAAKAHVRSHNHHMKAHAKHKLAKAKALQLHRATGNPAFLKIAQYNERRAVGNLHAAKAHKTANVANIAAAGAIAKHAGKPRRRR